MSNSDLSKAKTGKNDEFYTQFVDIQKELMSYLDFNPKLFEGKTILLPCDDPENSNFTKFFAQNFENLGIKKLISTSYAPESKNFKSNYQPTLFETSNTNYDSVKTKINGKIFILERDATGDGIIDVYDLEWNYLKGDGDYRSEEIKKLRDEADFIITNPPFSLFRHFLSWIVSADKKFLIIGNMNAITYKEVFPLIMNNKLWLGPTITSGDREFQVPDEYPVTASGWRIDEEGKKYLRIKGVRWFTNIDHGRRHQILPLMTMADNIKFNKKFKGKKMYDKYDNFDAIEVPFTDAIPSDYEGIMGVPISFLDKYNPDQIEIIGNGQTMANELGIRPVGQKFVDDYYQQGNKGQINAKWNNLVFHIEEKVVVPYQRILIKHKKNDY
jgi:hypothetical protein